MKNKKIIIITAISFIFIITAISSNYYKIVYLTDTIKSYFLLKSSKNNFASSYDLKKIYNIKITPTYLKIKKNFFISGNYIFYKSSSKMTVKTFAEQTIEITNFYSIRDYIKEIKSKNGLAKTKKFLPAGAILFIPNSVGAISQKTIRQKKPKMIYSRGLYFSGKTAGSKKFLNLIKYLRLNKINTIVFDAKDVAGIINYNSRLKDIKKYGTSQKRTIHNLPLLIRTLKKEKIYTIARVAVFQDHLLAKRNPNFAIHSKTTGKTWNIGKRELWCDPTNKSVQDYNINIAVELSNAGIDEIQFDYIRFPTSGKISDIKLKYDFGKMNKQQAIELFLKRAYNKISKSILSIDIFGVVAWGKRVDISKTGQNIHLLSKYCDVISPMLYPSHFSDDFDRKANPTRNPYYFIYTGCKKTTAMLSNKNVIIRPWLQAFKWRVDNYNQKYIQAQITASNDSGAYGYLFWNASNKYSIVYKTLNHQTDNKKATK